MAVLVVDDIKEVYDLVQLIAYLSRALADGDVDRFTEDGTLTLTKGSAPTPADIAGMVRMGEQELCENPDHRDVCSCRTDAANTDPRQGILLAAHHQDGPVRYEPCPQRGTHGDVRDCWMC